MLSDVLVYAVAYSGSDSVYLFLSCVGGIAPLSTSLDTALSFVLCGEPSLERVKVW